MTVRRLFTTSTIVLLCAAPGVRAAAQSSNDVAAWDALMLSPVGALAPLAIDVGAAAPGHVFALRYGYWRYDRDDSPHSNFGMTYAAPLTRRTQISLTAAYHILGCHECSGWYIAGAQVRSALWSTPPTAVLSAGVALRTDIGVAQYRGQGGASAGSAAESLDVSAGVALPHRSRLVLSLLPGIGVGRLASADETGQGARPLIGAALAWRSASGFAVDVGVQRIVIAGGPQQIGASLARAF
jgi:hypothetical protein